jgi:tetratricopeptide (TPR) repeat protein
MHPEDESLQKLRVRFTNLAVGSFFLMALLQGLHGFFFTLFFWPGVGFSVLAMYYYFAEKRATESNQARWQQSNASSVGVNPKSLRIILIAAAALAFLAVLIVAVSKKTDDSTPAEVQSQEPHPVEEEKKSSDYDRALQDYNNQDYRSSISIGRNGLLREPGNTDFMLVLGDDYGALKQYDSAFVWFDQAYQKGARSAYLSHWLGFLHDDKGNTVLALQFYKDALKQDSARKEVYDRLAELEPEKSDWYKAKSQQWAGK